MRLRDRQRAVGVGDQVAAVEGEGELLERFRLRGFVRAVRRERRQQFPPRAAGMRRDEVEHRAQGRRGGRGVERRRRARRGEIGARRVGRAEEREPARLEPAADGEEERRDVRPLFAVPRAADFALHVTVREFVHDRHRRRGRARDAGRLRRDFGAEDLFRGVALEEGGRRGGGLLRGLRGSFDGRRLRLPRTPSDRAGLRGLRGLRVGFNGGTGLRGLRGLRVSFSGVTGLRNLRVRFFRRLSAPHVDGFLRLLRAPLLDEFRVGHEFDARAVFGFGNPGAGRIAHGFEHAAGVAVVVGRAEQAARDPAAGDGRVFALRRFDVDFAFFEHVGEVGGELVGEELLRRAREPAARGALVKALLLVLLVELDARERGAGGLEEERHEFAQRHRAAALPDLGGDERERLVFGQEAHAEGRGLARRRSVPAEGAVPAERRAVAEGAVPAERRTLAGFRARPETAGSVFARRPVAEGRPVPARRSVAEGRPVSARRAVAAEAAAVPAVSAVVVAAAGKAFGAFAELRGVSRRVLLRPIRGEVQVRQEVGRVVCGVAVVHGGLRSAGDVSADGGETRPIVAESAEKCKDSARIRSSVATRPRF